MAYFNRQTSLKQLIVGLTYATKNNRKAITDAFAKLQPAEQQKLDNSYDSVQSLGLADKISAEDWRSAQSRTRADFYNADKAKVHVVTFLDENYPKNLKAIPEQPFPAVLYVKGDPTLFNSKPSVAMVGTRESTEVGDNVNRAMNKQFVNNGYTIVGGLAVGSDTVAHEATIANGGKTIAVLSKSLDKKIYPDVHASVDEGGDGLADRIVESGGALVSEIPMNQYIPDDEYRKTLVQRDSWQSGIADGVYANQTGYQFGGKFPGLAGGTRHAMNAAVKQNRPLAVPDAASLYDELDVTTPLSSFPEKFQGTQFAINSGMAQPINSAQALKSFIQDMQQGRQQRFEQLAQSDKFPPVNENELPDVNPSTYTKAPTTLTAKSPDVLFASTDQADVARPKPASRPKPVKESSELYVSSVFVNKRKTSNPDDPFYYVASFRFRDDINPEQKDAPASVAFNRKTGRPTYNQHLSKKGLQDIFASNGQSTPSDVELAQYAEAHQPLIRSHKGDANVYLVKADVQRNNKLVQVDTNTITKSEYPEFKSNKFVQTDAVRPVTPKVPTPEAETTEKSITPPVEPKVDQAVENPTTEQSVKTPVSSTETAPTKPADKVAPTKPTNDSTVTEPQSSAPDDAMSTLFDDLPSEGPSDTPKVEPEQPSNSTPNKPQSTPAAQPVDNGTTTTAKPDEGKTDLEKSIDDMFDKSQNDTSGDKKAKDNTNEKDILF